MVCFDVTERFAEQFVLCPIPSLAFWSRNLNIDTVIGNMSDLPLPQYAIRLHFPQRWRVPSDDFALHFQHRKSIQARYDFDSKSIEVGVYLWSGERSASLSRVSCIYLHTDPGLNLQGLPILRASYMVSGASFQKIVLITCGIRRLSLDR